MDFSEEELHLEHLAVRFKLEETRDEFKKIFEECQEELKKRPTPQKTEEAEKVA
jgi:RanBP1 domain